MSSQPIPHDQYGVYPALAGMVPASVGKRVAAVLLDSLVGVVFYLVVVFLVLGASSDGGFISQGGVLGMDVILSLLAIVVALTKGARIGGLLVGVRYVDVATGATNGPKTLGKLMLEGLVQVVTFGIAWVIVCFATLAKPSNRHAFDRALGLMAVDTRLGRGPGMASAGYQVPAIQNMPAPMAPIAPVTMPGSQLYPVPPATYVPQATPVTAPASYSPPIPRPHAVEETVPAQAVFGSGWQPPRAAPGPDWPGLDAADFAAVPPVDRGVPDQPPASVVAPDREVADVPATPSTAGATAAPLGGFIASTPFSRSDRPAVEPIPPAPLDPPVALREMRSVDADLVDHTILDAAAFLEPAGSAPALVLDGTQHLSLNVPVILGRNPVTPPGLDGARLVPVADSGMSISKSHVALGADGLEVWVLDLNSTNGTRVVDASGASTRLVPGQRTPLSRSATVHFGAHQVSVEQG